MKPKKTEGNGSKGARCYVCNEIIPQERVDALRDILNVPEREWCCVKCSAITKKQGIYMGESGTSELRIVDKVYNDSVRDVFKGVGSKDKDEDDDCEEDETDKQ